MGADRNRPRTRRASSQPLAAPARTRSPGSRSNSASSRPGEASESDLIAALYEIGDLWPNNLKSRKTIDHCFEAGTGHPRSYPGPKASNGRAQESGPQSQGNTSGDDAASSEPDPAPLPSGLPPVPALLPDMLPQGLRAWLVDIADRAQAPLDFVAVGAIVALSSALGRRLAIRPKRRDDWDVVPNLWGVPVGPPGILKSPMLRETVKPLWRLEAQAKEQNKRELEEFELKKAAVYAERGRIIAQAKRLKTPIEREKLIEKLRDLRCRAAAGAAIPDQRHHHRKTGELLSANPYGLMIFRDELRGFLAMMDRSGHEADREFYLEGLNGNGQYNFDRIGRGGVTVKGLCVSILGGATPGPLSAYLREVFSGECDDGLIQRFQLAVYPDLVKDWVNVDRFPDTAAKNRAFAIFERLVKLAEIAPREDAEMPWLGFDDSAQVFFDDWRGQLERRIRNSDEHPIIIAHLAKYRLLMPSLALIFHLCDADELCPVTLEASKRAAWWCDESSKPTPAASTTA